MRLLNIGDLEIILTKKNPPLKHEIDCGNYTIKDTDVI